jgi:hypothetical protein
MVTGHQRRRNYDASKKTMVLFFLFFLYIIFFGITQDWQTYKDFTMRNPRPTRTQATKCGSTFAFVCIDFRFRSRTWRGSAPTVHPVPKSRKILAAAILYPLYSAIAVLALCPQTQGYRKSQLFRTNGRSDRASQARTSAKRSAIHYEC